MDAKKWAETLWGNNARLLYLIIASIVLLFGFLGNREMWTQEHRWADIVASMFFYHDYLHPVLNGREYYDKPLLSYWLIAGLSQLTGGLNLWTLRLPSAFAGLLSVFCIYRIGVNLHDKRLGLLAGWMLLTTYYFAFWARVSNADMLNLAGSLCAVSWYFETRNHPGFLNYAIFFVILAITALFKGLVGPVVALIAIFPDVILQNNWRKHLNVNLFLAVIPAIILYVLPFWASTHFGNETYEQDGLYTVYRENIMRYLHPFDHRGSIFTYLIYLPIYLLPWAFFFIPALIYLIPRWRTLSLSSKWMVFSTLLLFVFFSFSGSRRSYYILPVVPYAILMTADWIVSGKLMLQKRNSLAGMTAVSMLLFLAFAFLVLQPVYYAKGGVKTFKSVLKAEANKIKPWETWRFELLDAESKVNYYLKLSPDIQSQDTEIEREKQTTETLLQDWPVLSSQPRDTIIISRKLHENLLRNILNDYIVVESECTYLELLLKKRDNNLPVAFIPKQKG